MTGSGHSGAGVGDSPISARPLQDLWVDYYRAPRWPDQTVPQQFHLDFAVDDLDEAEARLLELGASKPDHQPTPGWRVLTDPAGHPFCLVSG